jgi:hypothetical protein
MIMVSHDRSLEVHERTDAPLLAVFGTERDIELCNSVAWLGPSRQDGRFEFAALSTDGVRVWVIEVAKRQ